MGVRSAVNQRALAESLRQERLLLMKAVPLPNWVGGSGAKISLKDQSQLSDILGQLLTRGVPLVETLQVSEETVPSRIRQRVAIVRQKVAAGSSFADAAQAAGLVDAVTGAVYRAAERSGDLGGAAQQVAKTARRQLAVRGKAATVMVYPAIVLTMSLLIGTGMMMFIVPMILGELQKMSELNLFSQIVLTVGTFMRTYWWGVVLFAVGILMTVVLGRKIVGRLVGGLMRKLPVMRDLVLAQESAGFFSVLSALSRSGVPLGDAIGIGRNVISHPRLYKQFGTLQTQLIEGAPLPRLIDNVTALSPATRHLLVAAERSGDLDSAFDTLAEDLTVEVDRQTSRLLAALEPMVIVMMFLIIGTIILSIMIPMITSAGKGLG